jgi:hypothetical protein
MRSLNSSFHLFLVFALFFHGAAYFITGDIYDKDNPVKLIKYLLSIIYCGSLFFFLLKDTKTYYFFKIFSIWFILFSLSLFYAFLNLLPIDFVVFIFLPFLYVFVHMTVSEERLIKALVILLWFSFLFMILEFLFFSDVSSRFDQSGFRSISIFVNPNAFGVTVVLFFLAVSFRIKNSFYLFVLSIITLSMVLLSGSKTAMGAYFLLMTGLMILYVWKHKGIFLLFLCICIPAGVAQSIYSSSLSSSDSIETRSFDLQSGLERLKELNHFVNAADDCLLIPYHCDNAIYLDNTFIYAWISLGLPGLLLITLCFIFSTVLSAFVAVKRRSYFFLCFFLLFWLMSMSTNLMNIWPTSYVFWIVFGYMLKRINGSWTYG